MGLGTQELMIVLIILVLLFGARKLPELARALGRSVSELRHAAETDEPPAAEQDG